MARASSALPSRNSTCASWSMLSTISGASPRSRLTGGARCRCERVRAYSRRVRATLPKCPMVLCGVGRAASYVDEVSTWRSGRGAAVAEAPLTHAATRPLGARLTCGAGRHHARANRGLGCSLQLLELPRHVRDDRDEYVREGRVEMATAATFDLRERLLDRPG